MNKLILLILFSLSYCNSVIGQDSHIHFIEKPDFTLTLYINKSFILSILHPVPKLLAAILPARKPMNGQTILIRWDYGLASEASTDWIFGIIRIAFPSIKKNITALSGLPASKI